MLSKFLGFLGGTISVIVSSTTKAMTSIFFPKKLSGKAKVKSLVSGVKMIRIIS